MDKLVERFLRYVAVDTQSSEESTSSPTTAKQHNLAKLLAEELRAMGASDVSYDAEYCYVYAKIPATDGGKQTKTLGFLAHMDTSPEVSDEGVRARIVKNYDGGDIVLNEDGPIVLRLADFPEMAAYAGKSLIVTDGTTLLGADDKAGVAEIMTMAAHLLAHPEFFHGPIAIAFTPDEEVGAGVDNIDLAQTTRIPWTAVFWASLSMNALTRPRQPLPSAGGACIPARRRTG